MPLPRRSSVTSLLSPSHINLSAALCSGPSSFLSSSFSSHLLLPALLAHFLLSSSPSAAPPDCHFRNSAVDALRSRSLAIQLALRSSLALSRHLLPSQLRSRSFFFSSLLPFSFPLSRILLSLLQRAPPRARCQTTTPAGAQTFFFFFRGSQPAPARPLLRAFLSLVFTSLRFWLRALPAVSLCSSNHEVPPPPPPRTLSAHLRLTMIYIQPKTNF